MKTICTKSRYGLELLGVKLSIDGHDYEVCGRAKQEYKGGMVCEWWIIIDETPDEKKGRDTMAHLGAMRGGDGVV